MGKPEDSKQEECSAQTEKTKIQPRFGAMELIASTGLSAHFALVLYINYWLYIQGPTSCEMGLKMMLPVSVFVGNFVGYFLYGFFGKRFPRDKQKKTVTIGMNAAMLICLILLFATLLCGVVLPMPVYWLIDFAMGAIISSSMLNWLRMSIQTRILNHFSFIGIAFLVGLILTCFIACFLTFGVQLAAVTVFTLLSACCAIFVGERSGGMWPESQDEGDAQAWGFGKEVVPLFIVYGIVFGLAMAYLFSQGLKAMTIGFAFAFAGTLIMIVISRTRGIFNILAFQRLSLPICLVGCLFMTFPNQVISILSAGMVMGMWAMFMTVNYSTLIYKCIISNAAQSFYIIPRKLAFPFVGFCIGWIVAAFLFASWLTDVDAFVSVWIVRLIGVIPVIIFAIFLPEDSHHRKEASKTSPESEKAQPAKTVPVVVLNLSESELYERRCKAVAKLHQLSAREYEVLRFLAKGRNVSYMQEEFVLSPCTIKSHIYNIYRKTDIHSQQKIMDYVESFPIEGE